MLKNKQVKKIVLAIAILMLFLPLTSVMLFQAVTPVVEKQDIDLKTSDIYTYTSGPTVPIKALNVFWVNDYYNGIGSQAVWPLWQSGWASAIGGGVNGYNFDGWAWQSVMQIVDVYVFDVISPDFDVIPLDLVPIEAINVKFRLAVGLKSGGGGFCDINIFNNRLEQFDSIQRVSCDGTYKYYDLDIEAIKGGISDFDLRDYINSNGQVVIQVHTVNDEKWVGWVHYAPGIIAVIDLATVEVTHAISDSPIMILTPLQTTYDKRNDNIMNYFNFNVMNANGIPEIDSIKYKLDGGDLITPIDDHFVSIPDAGDHLVQVLGYDIDGTEYSSNIITITIIDQSIRAESYVIITGNLISGDLMDTVHYDQKFLSIQSSRYDDPYVSGFGSRAIIRIDIPDIRLGLIRIQGDVDDFKHVYGEPPLQITVESFVYFEVNYVDGSKDYQYFWGDIHFKEIILNPRKYVDTITIVYAGEEYDQYTFSNMHIDCIEFLPYNGEQYFHEPEKIGVFIWASDVCTDEIINRYINILEGEGYDTIFNIQDPENFEDTFNFIDNYEKESDTIFFYLMGHGGAQPETPVSFSIFNPGGEWVLSSDFRIMMDRLETPRKAHLVESCDSGDWANLFQSEPYLAMSSSDVDHLSFGITPSLPFEGKFSYYFFNHVESGYNAIDSFYYAKGIVESNPDDYYSQYPQIASFSSYDFFAN